jgi:hypothetical protein
MPLYKPGDPFRLGKKIPLRAENILEDLFEGINAEPDTG